MDAKPPSLSPDEGLPRALELKAAAILAVLAALILGAVAYVMYARGVFEKSQTLILIAEDASGVDVGMEMTFAGFAIGRVTRVSLHDDGRARLRVEIPSRDSKWLRESSVFVLEKGLIGSPQLKAYTGVIDGPILADGAQRNVLYGDVSAQIPQITLAAKELLQHLASLTNEDSALAMTLNNLRLSTQRLNAKHGALGVLLGNDQDAAAVAQVLTAARNLVKTLDGLVASSDRMVKSADQQVFGQSGLLASADRMVKNADQQVFGQTGLLAEVQASATELTQLLSQLRQSMVKVDDILKNGQGIAQDTKAATVDLVALRAQVEASLRQVDSLLNEINTRWPLPRRVEVNLP